jgi:anti-anti-sigma factor
MARSRYFDVQVEGPVTVVKFTEAYLNDSNIQQIGNDLAAIADELNRGELHLDFSAVTYLSSIVLGKLLTLHQRVTREGGRFVLTHVDALYDVFNVARLDKLLEIRRQQSDQEPPSSTKPA